MRLIAILLSFVAFVAEAWSPKFPENCHITGTAESGQDSFSMGLGHLLNVLSLATNANRI
jgi:hypothetical protein